MFRLLAAQTAGAAVAVARSQKSLHLRSLHLTRLGERAAAAGVSTGERLAGRVAVTAAVVVEHARPAERSARVPEQVREQYRPRLVVRADKDG